jgi:hypothetical protein
VVVGEADIVTRGVNLFFFFFHSSGDGNQVAETAALNFVESYVHQERSKENVLVLITGAGGRVVDWKDRVDLVQGEEVGVKGRCRCVVVTFRIGA